MLPTFQHIFFVTKGGRATLEFFFKDFTQYEMNGICCEVELKICMEVECPKKKKVYKL